MLAESKLADHSPLGDSKVFTDRLPNSSIGSGFVGRTEGRGGIDVYVGKGVVVDWGSKIGLGVRVEGKERDEDVAVSIHSNDTLNVRPPHADRTTSSNNEITLAPVRIFPIHPVLCDLCPPGWWQVCTRV